MKTVTVNVTQEDIERGVHGSATMCPLAIAIRRATKSPNVSVGAIRWRCRHYSALLPDVAFKFAERFDYHERVFPFTFELEVPDDV